MPKILQIDEQGNVLAVADLPWEPGEGAILLHPDDEPLTADLHKVKFDHASKRLAKRSKLECDKVDAERAEGSPFERAVKTEVEKRVKDLEARLSRLEKKSPR